MRAMVLENLMMGTLDPLNIPVTMTIRATILAIVEKITSIKWSCKGEKSCLGAGRGKRRSSGTGGYINGINKACLGDSSCFKAAAYGGYINGISKACLTDSSCFYAARDGKSVDSGIKNCVCDTCAGALGDASLSDECGEKLDFGELFDELNVIIKSKIDP